MSDAIMSKRWFKWTLAVTVVLAVLVLSAAVWNAWGKPEVNQEAERKAQELFDLARGAGLLQEVEDEAAFVDDLAQVYGSDGGYGVEVAESSLADAVLTYDLARTGEVTQRPIIADPQFLQLQLLVLKVYEPVLYQEKILPFIKGLKLEGELPAWLEKDLQTL